MGKLISFLSLRSGVGKTSFALKVAETVANSGKSVIILDLDPKGDLSRAFGLKREFSILNILDKSREFHEVVQKTAIKNILILPSNIGLSRIEKGNLLELQKKLSEVLQYLRGKFDYLLIDAPPYDGSIFQISNEISDQIVVPVKMEKMAPYFLEKSLKELEREKVKVVLNFYSDSSAEIFANIVKNFGDSIVKESEENFLKIDKNLNGEWKLLL
jgi:chromosome partitioning protein